MGIFFQGNIGRLLQACRVTASVREHGSQPALDIVRSFGNGFVGCDKP
jgi:hypothetical protein